MLLNRLLEGRERYREALPQPFYQVARAGWKVGIKPALKIVTVLLGKSKGFDFPKDDKGTRKAVDTACFASLIVSPMHRWRRLNSLH
jgi:hypothetical protein